MTHKLAVSESRKADLNQYNTSAASASSFLALAAATIAKYEMTFFVFSVFPAPDSPLQYITLH